MNSFETNEKTKKEISYPCLPLAWLIELAFSWSNILSLFFPRKKKNLFGLRGTRIASSWNRQDLRNTFQESARENNAFHTFADISFKDVKLRLTDNRFHWFLIDWLSVNITFSKGYVLCPDWQNLSIAKAEILIDVMAARHNAGYTLHDWNFFFLFSGRNRERKCSKVFHKPWWI